MEKNIVIHKFRDILEHDMDMLILEEFACSAEFTKIFLNKIGVDDAKVLLTWQSKTDAELGESDMTIVFERNDKKIALLIEDKIDAIAMPEQPARYVLRGNKGVTDGEYDTYYIFIVAPQEYLEKNEKAKEYPNSVSYEEIRDYFTFSDVIDPEVTNYKIMDADEYFENPKLAGEYLIRICAYDMYNNEGVKHVKLIVLDLDFPAISIDSNNTIIVEKGAEVTKEQIIEFLNASGMLEGEVVDVSIEGYDEENPSGSYEMSIELADGTVINNKLVIREDVNYETPLVEKDYSIVIVVCVVCGILLVVSTLYFGNVSRRRVRR
jgi:hypothetical protein